MVKARVLTALMMVAMAAAAYADDTKPPDWRGHMWTVEAHWEFDSASAFTPKPYKTIGGAGAKLHWKTAKMADPAKQHFTWRRGIWWNLGEKPANMFFYLPNWVREQPWKNVRFQATYYYYDELPPAPVKVYKCYGFKEPKMLEGELVKDLSEPGQFVQDWAFKKINPYWEEFILEVKRGVGLGQVDIDTRCIPEPGTLSLVALGSLALLRRRA